MTDDADRYGLRFEFTAETAVAVMKLAHTTTFRLAWIAAFVSFAVAVVCLLVGFVFGAVIMLGLGLSTALLGLDPVQHWFARREGRGVLGEIHEIRLDEASLHYQTPMGTGLIPWSAITAIRENDRIVMFMRERVPLAYIPASAFESPAQRAEVVGYARERIGAARGSSPDEG